MTYIPRSMTNTEKALIRTNGQSSALYLGIYTPPVIFSARVNQTFSSKDKVIEISYDGAEGDIADVIPGMTLWVGSGTSGTYRMDKGQCRIRKAPTGDTFFVGENSDILWADDAYLYVVDDFDLWARYISINSNVPFMDYDIAYSNQHTNTCPIPCIGPRLIPVWLNSDGEVVVSFDASESWTLPDTSISAYVWTAPGNIFATGPLTATPTFKYDSPGAYRVSCQVYSANGNSTTAYAYILIYDLLTALPITQFQLKSCTGSHSENGWKFAVTMWAEAGVDSVVDRAHVVLFARDWYDGTTEVSIGPIEHRENILAIGRIMGESILQDPDASTVDFTIEGISAWMKKTTNFAIGIQNSTLPAAAWTDWFNLKVDSSLYHLFFWQSTLIPVVDVYLTEDVRISQEQYAPGETSIFDQLTYLLKNVILGTAGADRFNRFFCEVDTQLTPVVDRDFSIIMALEPYDWRDQLPITRIPTQTISQVNLSGVVISPPKKPQPLFSLAPGHVFYPLGKPARQDKLLLSTQAKANDLAAMLLAWGNHEFEFSPDLAGNNRMVDVFPSHQYVRMIIAADDTPREFIYTGNMIVREISYSLDVASSSLQISWKGENETFPHNSTDGDLPEESEVPTENWPVDTEPIDPEEPVLIPSPESIDNVVVLIRGTGVFWTRNFSSEPAEVIWYSMTEGFPDPEAYPPLIHAIEVSQSGRCFCQVGFDSIWSAPAPGAAWSKVFDTTMIGNPEGYPFPRDPRVIGFGIDRDSNDSLLIIAGLKVTIFSTYILYAWKGDSSGVVMTTPVFFNDGSDFAGLIPGMVTYSNGKWTALYTSAGSAAAAISFDSSGLVDGLATYLPTSSYIQARSRYGYSTVFIPNSPNFTSQDNGGSFQPLFGSPTPYPGHEAVSSNPNGNLFLLGTQFLGMKRSPDAGATWEPTSTLAAVTCVWNLGTDNDWLFAFVGQILYTPDFGDTFYYHTGDLQTYAGPFFIISQIRYY